MICLHVDDGLYAGDDYFRSVLEKYYERFKDNPEKGSGNKVEYIGAEIAKTDGETICTPQNLFGAVIDGPEIDPESERFQKDLQANL